MKKLLIAMAAVSAVGLVQVANAAFIAGGGGTITFQGVVKKDSCYANPGRDSNIDFPLGTVQASALTDLANATGSALMQSKVFTIECGSGDKVTMTFAPGSEVDAAGTVLRVNSGNTGTNFASGVGIVMLDDQGAVMNIKSGSFERSFAATATESAKQRANFTLRATYIRTGTADAVVPGIANASLPFLISYE